MSVQFKIKVLNFLFNTEIYGRRKGSKLVKETFGEEGYLYYQDLWKRKCLKVNYWNLIEPTKKGYLEERKIKGWDRK